MSRRAGPVLLAVLAAAASDARAWAPIDPSMPVWRPPVPYSMNNAGSADLGVATSEMIVQTAMGDWTRVSCTSLTATYRGQVATRAGAGDGQSVIGWHESSWPYDPNAIGVTGPRWSSNILEADMELNGVNYRWITGPGSGTSVNTYSIVLHEGGHYYGLGHSADSAAAMYFAYSGGVSTLTADDQNGICALYPGGTSDCTTTGCPSGQTCMSGTCVATTMPGTGSTCSPCTSGADCANGVCLGYPDGSAHCGHNCTSAADCGTSEMCVPVTGAGGQCVRFSGGTPGCSSTPPGCTSDASCPSTQRCNTTTHTCENRPSTGAPLGGACTAGADCMSALCFAGACTQSCDWLNPLSCPAGYHCSGEATGSCTTGGGVCVAGGAGGGAAGAPCSAAGDCASAYCVNGVCTTPCIPGGAAGCPDGSSCQVGAVAGCGSCQTSGSIGDACAMNADCTSRLCATLSGESFCTQTCDAAMACPTGFACTDTGVGVSVCTPTAGGLGSTCTTNADCLSGSCATDGSSRYCTRTCDRRTAPCPSGFNCVASEDPNVHVCQRPGGCGCSAPGAGRGAGGGLGLLCLLGLVALASARRRR